MKKTIQNKFLTLSIDDRGRIISLRNRITNTELITHRDASEAWRLVVATGRHTRDFIYGSQQKPKKIDIFREDKKQHIILSYDKVIGSGVIPLNGKFILSLEDGSNELQAYAELENLSRLNIEEIEFPVVGGLGGFPENKRRIMRLVSGTDEGCFHGDALNHGLPSSGRESNHYVRENETTFLPEAWMDLYGDTQGLYFGYHSKGETEFVFKVEKFPKETPNAPVHCYPENTPRWLRVSCLHAPQVAGGAKWTSEKIRIMPHKGDWHLGADAYSAYRHKNLKLADTPPWMKSFVGWSEILGKTYLGEIFHDYRKCADEVIKDKKVTGTNLVFYYGHTAIGAEGADFDHLPAPDLGGKKEFKKMVDRLHKNNCRIILLDHFHGYINKNIPQYKQLNLEKHAILDENGSMKTSKWWKETFLSCCKLAGPTPEWVAMCPATEEWQEYYIKHVSKMVEMGVDGLQLDCFLSAPACYNPKHKHARGARLFPLKMEFMRKARSHAKGLNPDFVLFAETMIPEVREVVDGFYPPCRYWDENGRIYRYIFPEITEQTVFVGNYAYDAVNKALSLGLGIETEIWGLRKITVTACPELAEYIGEINRFKRKYADILIHGRYRDTLGAKVTGDILYSVLLGPEGNKALVLRNNHNYAVKCTAALRETAGKKLMIWRPYASEKELGKLPFSITLKPYEAAVLLALGNA